MAIRLLDLGVVSYLRSQAVYPAVAQALNDDVPDTLILCAPDRPHFCVGFHQDPRQELDLDFCRANQLPVVRRWVGGGTTYLDSNQLYYQLVIHHRRAPMAVEALYRFALAAPVATLCQLGLHAELTGVNELVVMDALSPEHPRGGARRIAGLGAGRIGEASVVVGNFLFDFDYATMARAWRVPSETYRRLAREGLERYVTTLRRELGHSDAVPGPSMAEVKARLIENFAVHLGRPLVAGELTSKEEALVKQIEHTLTTDEWLYEIQGEPRPFLKIADGVQVREAVCYLLVGASEGQLHLTMRLYKGQIDALDITPQGGFGGFIWEALATALRGTPLQADALRQRIQSFEQAGLIPHEINLAPLISTLVKIGREVGGKR